LRHHTIHCLSVTASFFNVTGMSIEEFGLLFADLLPDLRAKWPNCPPTAGPDEFGTLRFKLFLTLFCLRRYQPYQSMEVTFGWSASAIGVWCDTILAIMDEKYASFRVFPGKYFFSTRIINTCCKTLYGFCWQVWLYGICFLFDIDIIG